MTDEQDIVITEDGNVAPGVVKVAVPQIAHWEVRAYANGDGEQYSSRNRVAKWKRFFSMGRMLITVAMYDYTNNKPNHLEWCVGSSMGEKARDLCRIWVEGSTPESMKSWVLEDGDRFLADEYVMRTTIDELKQQWLRDPAFQLEGSEGYEAYFDELLEFSKNAEAENAKRHRERMQSRSEMLGIPGNIALIQYIENLEYTIQSIQSRIDNIEGHVDFSTADNRWTSRYGS
jgi:hypothetical protein